MLPPFQELVDAYWRDVARLCRALCSPSDAEDAAQRAWLRALRAYPSVRHARNLRGWLLTIAARAATDEHRQRGRRPMPVAELPDAALSPARASSARADDHVLWERVRMLPARQQTAVALRYVLDLPHAEIARFLGTTSTASRRLVSDALAVLRSDPELIHEVNLR